ncbi:MAG: hypothetical protein IKY07_01775 [Clostridia bacterium]|nr:hypothetical protein [Clostridia bacterium]
MKKIIALAVAALVLVSMTSCFSGIKKILDKVESVLDDGDSKAVDTESGVITEKPDSTSAEKDTETEPVTQTEEQTEEPAVPSDGEDLIGTWAGSVDISDQINREMEDAGIDFTAESFLMNYVLGFDGEKYSFSLDEESLRAECDAFAEKYNKVMPDIVKKSLEEAASQLGQTVDEYLAAATEGAFSSFEEYWNSFGSMFVTDGDDYFDGIMDSFVGTDETLFNGNYTVEGNRILFENGEDFVYAVDGDTLTISEGENNTGLTPFPLPAELTKYYRK